MRGKKLKSILLRGKQSTLISGILYSRISVFSLIEVLLIFLKYLRRVLFPSRVVSASSGLVLYFCQEFDCLITGSRF